MLKLEHLSCGYGAVEAVRDVSLEVPSGSIFALLGPNGAGKTSTIMAVMGHVDIHGGHILLEGEDITRRRPVDRVGLGIALVPEGRQLFSDLTIDENLTVGGYARPSARDTAKRERVFGYFPRLAERRSQLAGSLSGGEQQMLAIGRALMAEPRLLLVDELSLGLMPKMVDLCLDALTQLKREGLTVVLVEQNTARALDVADKVCVMSSGVQIYQGTAIEAKAAGSMFATFLGMNEPAQQ
ncbi:ABC transporter ATP-binding protein [Bradyrhizobium elkanii]|uniref:Branched-chain amino acid transport system ATP-binding protein n=1 Tax=Bradyrhizobium elkanii TaxID=29448 RepID=A0A8I2C7I0_BRAEL|nr:ABC transporter ATP-binding protein [Bradyrhizobium elkanii]MBP1296377.1 branched-chain amino acid transport system ATP-binding protein [Bradyrhizobium elkanii]